MLSTSEKKWMAAGLAAAVLYAVTRSEKGQQVTSDALEEIIVAGGSLLARGVRNNNPGNIKFLPAARAFKGQLPEPDEKGFGRYDTAANGVRAIGKQLLAYENRGLTTVRKIASTWSATDQEAYVANMAKALNVGADSPLPVSNRLAELAGAIVRQENGFNPYTDREIANWVHLA
jgi:hypothetical protein